MTPVPEWRRILKHAWSVRFMVLSIVLSSAGGALMLINPQSTGRPFLFAGIVFLLSASGGLLGLAARFVKQKDIP
jgi:hypothetical protein